MNQEILYLLNNDNFNPNNFWIEIQNNHVKKQHSYKYKTDFSDLYWKDIFDYLLYYIKNVKEYKSSNHPARVFLKQNNKELKYDVKLKNFFNFFNIDINHKDCYQNTILHFMCGLERNELTAYFPFFLPSNKYDLVGIFENIISRKQIVDKNKVNQTIVFNLLEQFDTMVFKKDDENKELLYIQRFIDFLEKYPEINIHDRNNISNIDILYKSIVCRNYKLANHLVQCGIDYTNTHTFYTLNNPPINNNPVNYLDLLSYSDPKNEEVIELFNHFIKKLDLFDKNEFMDVFLRSLCDDAKIGVDAKRTNLLWKPILIKYIKENKFIGTENLYEKVSLFFNNHPKTQEVFKYHNDLFELSIYVKVGNLELAKAKKQKI